MSLYDLEVRELVKKFPNSAGVYLMYDKQGNVIYIGKAISLKKRVMSYFARTLNPKTSKLVSEVQVVKFKKTASVIEALVLEANLIKLYQPKYNIKLKDDKYFASIVITDHSFPQILVKHYADTVKNAKYVFGPYTSKRNAQQVVDFLVRFFILADKPKNTAYLYLQYYIKGYASGKLGDVSLEGYNRGINFIKLFLSGKKRNVITTLQKEMQKMAVMENYEEAAIIRNQIYALKNIQDTAFLHQDDLFLNNECESLRIEGYDISHISGQFAVGSMVVFSGPYKDTASYRHFKIKQQVGADDLLMMQEVIVRRFQHSEWPLPDVIVVDGGLTQVSAVQSVLDKLQLNIPLVGIAKGPNRKGEKLFFAKSANQIIKLDLKLIKQVRDEAHRFAVTYHRKVRSANYKK